MIRRLLLAAALLAAAPVAAQTVTVTAPNTVNPSGQPTAVNKTFIVNPDGSIATVSASGGTGTASSQVQGNTANGTTDVGNPVKVGGKANTAPPTAVTNGQRVDAWYGLQGQAVTMLARASGDLLAASSTVSDSRSATDINLHANTFGHVFNGTNWDRARGDTTGAYVVQVPTAAAAGGIVPSATTAVSAGVVAKASAGNVYRVAITTGASAGYLMGFNATSIPADGAVTPSMCRAVAANTSLSVSYADLPSRWSTGITFVFSTTGCFTKTGSATAYLEWTVL